MRPRPLQEFSADLATVQVFSTREEAGQAAAHDVASGLIGRLSQSGPARVVFAAAPSQNEFLAHLADCRDLDWSRVSAFHMDEYVGLPADHPAAFRLYLQRHLFDLVPLGVDQVHLIGGDCTDRLNRVCTEYEDALRQSTLDLVCGGIGENGHLAFNDPPVADFRDPVWVKPVRLDHDCRVQQVNDGCFATIDDVPLHAVTLTIPALLSAKTISLVVPGPRKALAVRHAIRGAISEACPASIIRTHAGASLYLDSESSALL